jgi:GNAT superfamily N-acetyltransferase
MMMRLAREDDRPALLDMVKKFITYTPYSHYPVVDDKINELITGCLDYTKNIIFVYTTDEDQPVGMLAATSTQFLFNRELIASEMAWWVEPSYRGRGGRLLKTAFEHWARHIGAKYSHMSSLDTPLVNALLERDGYRKTECTFVKEL